MTADPQLAAKLRAILLAFRGELKPELQTPNAKLRGELIDMLLSRLVSETDGADPGPGFWDALAEIFPELGDGGAREARLSELLSQPGALSQASAGIARIAAAESRRRAGYEVQVAETLGAASVATGSASELDIPADSFTAYLRGKFPDDPQIRATNVVTVPGGRSKGTILLDVEGSNGPRQIVVRKDFGASVTGTSVAYEYPVVRAAWQAGLPVPEPFWLEDDPTAIGGRFIAFERLPGKAMGTLFQSDASPAFAREFAAVLGRLHSLDIDQAGLAHDLRWAAEPDPVGAMLDSFYERYRSKMRPNPLMDAAFAWLRLQLDTLDGPRALIHGDAGVHNTLGEGDRLTALLDWEFAHCGDPAEDLTYCKYLIERILPWDDFMQAYLGAGGRPVSEARMRFFTIWRTLHLSILTGGALELFESGGDQDLRIATIGYNTFPKQLRDLAQDLAAFTAES